jgi:hypothetical protein
MIQRVEGEKFLIGAEKGWERFKESRKMNIDPNKRSGFDINKNILARDIQGSLAEVAVADFLGVKDFIPTVNNFKVKISNTNKYTKDPDIEPNIEVRSVQYDSKFPNKKKSLIIRNHEGENIDNFFKRKFVLAIVHYDNMKEQLAKGFVDVDIKGWIIGEDGMDSKYIFNPNKHERGANPAYFVPINNLIPF